MDWFFDSIRWIHVIAGFTGLAAFWVPIFTRKGGSNHRFYGKIFKYCAYFVLGMAGLSIGIRIPMALAEGVTPITHPTNFSFIVFLGYLTLVTFIGIRHGFGVLNNKSDITQMNTPLNRSLAWIANGASVFLILYAIILSPPTKVILYALSPIGFGTGFGILASIRNKKQIKKMWFYEHMGALLGTGIAFHTAFAVFGSSRLFDLGLTGFVAVIPWITPALIGIPATIIWTRHYQRKFGDLPAADSADSTTTA